MAVFQYKVHINVVVRFGEHQLVLFWSAVIACTLPLMVFLPCYAMFKIKKPITADRNQAGNQAVDIKSFIPWIVSTSLSMFEVWPKFMLLLFVVDTCCWMTLCRLLQRLFNGFVFISLIQHFWRKFAEEEEGNKNSSHLLLDKQHHNQQPVQFCPKIILVVTDEGIHEKTMFRVTTSYKLMPFVLGVFV